MRRWSAISILTVYTLGATNACQLLKMPLLVTHYVKHKSESPFMTLRSFIKMHYIDPQPFDADYAQDMQLPFKTTPDALCRNILLFASKLPAIVINSPLEISAQQAVFDDKMPLVLLVNTIFQPPRA
jgi:hypothetical protein